jgi:two-component system response regulator HydG
MQQDQIGRAGHDTASPKWATPPRILVIDDEPDACEALRLVLTAEGYGVTPETSAFRALERVATDEFDLVMSDVSMREMDGLDLCRRLVEARPGVPVILVTGRSTVSTAVGALRSGATDFLTKPVDVPALILSVARALEHVTAARASQAPPSRAPSVARLAARRELAGSDSEPMLAKLLGRSASICELRQRIADLSGSVASVIIQGETGTGKELVAQAIHATSPFRNGPFVALNCAAMPPGLLESELFGHVRGAFTDAKVARTGLLVQANGGTLLLDEIGELPLAMQPKLLRALQERTVRPVGAHQEIPFHCRIIAASNRDLDVEVLAKRFREDLYYRLDVVRLSAPPLRERGDDILLLAEHFLSTFSQRSGRAMTLHPSAAEKLVSYRWPGNVRELENCLESAVALARGDELSVDDLPEKVRLGGSAQLGLASDAVQAGVPSLAELERSHTLKAIEQLGGNMTRVAKLLGIDRTTLYRRLRRYGVDAAN